MTSSSSCSNRSSLTTTTTRGGGAGGARLPPTSAGRVETIDDLMRDVEEVEVDESFYGSAAYVWEQDLDRSWDALEETDGVLGYKATEEPDVGRGYARGNEGIGGEVVRRGMIRNLVILMDMSFSMRELDFRPDRLNCALDLVEHFIREFFQQNPIGQMASLVMLDSDAFLVQALSASPEEQITKLREAKRKALSGAPSLMNGLERSLAILTSLPLYGSREVLIIFGSLRTCDAGNIEEIMPALRTASVRVSCISMAPELYILKRICNATEGDFCVPCSKANFEEALRHHTQPLPWTSSFQPSLVRMGFPYTKKSTTASLCICHRIPTYKGVVCPLCGSKVCEVPTRCQCCSLHLVSPAGISRTSHHLFPPSGCSPLVACEAPCQPYICGSCGKTFRKGGGQCLDCKAIVCYECDIYSHDQLHHCPHCMMRDLSKVT
eukprot:GHVS01090323.1.p1 GENE.GHVS01090323.1~~GHVS01090323.1.p1  ORF type:complete len:469 (-),score=85.81 GHVS01090323.1:74-1384(-)